MKFNLMNKQNFVDMNPSLSTYWRVVKLLCRNTVSYKFALLVFFGGQSRQTRNVQPRNIQYRKRKN